MERSGTSTLGVHPPAAPAGAALPPSVREVARSAGGRDMPRQRRGIRGDVGIAPYARLPHLHLALALSFRASAHTGVGIRSPFRASGGPWPPPTFAAPRQRRDLIIANPRRVFPKREGRSPPSLVAQGWGIFKGEGRSKLPSPLNGVLWILSFAKERKYPAGGIPRRGAELPCLSGKKVTRRRQKRKKKKEKKAARRRPSYHLSILLLRLD